MDLEQSVTILKYIVLGFTGLLALIDLVIKREKKRPKFNYRFIADHSYPDLLLLEVSFAPGTAKETIKKVKFQGCRFAFAGDTEDSLVNPLSSETTWLDLKLPLSLALPTLNEVEMGLTSMPVLSFWIERPVNNPRVSITLKSNWYLFSRSSTFEFN